MDGLRQVRCAAGRRLKKSLAVQRVSALPSPREGAGQLDLCNCKSLCYTLARSRTTVRLFPDSSAVEHSTVNRMVAGSNPAPGAIRCSPLFVIVRNAEQFQRLARKACTSSYAGVPS